MSAKTVHGFTLIELMVVVSIIAILSLVGMTVYTGVQKSARDTKRKADIDAISKAYEANYNNSYQALTDNNFASGEVPDPPEGGDYFNWLSQDGSGFKVCAALDDNENTACNTPAQNCYCKASAQGAVSSTSSSFYDPSSTLTGLGFGGSSQSSCDTNGTLLSGLVGYWKMDENAGATTFSDSSGYGSNASSVNGAGITTSGKFGNAVSFDGVDDRVLINSLPTSTFATASGPITVSLWFKPNTVSGVKYLMTDSCLELGLRTNNLTSQGIAYATVGGGTLSTTPPNGFYHIALVHDHSPGYPNTQIKLFLDGIKYEINYVIDTGIPYIGYLDLPFNLGVNGCLSAGTYTEFFNGQIDDVRIYNRALSETEVANLFNGGSGCLSN